MARKFAFSLLLLYPKEKHILLTVLFTCLMDVWTIIPSVSQEISFCTEWASQHWGPLHCQHSLLTCLELSPSSASDSSCPIMCSLESSRWELKCLGPSQPWETCAMSSQFWALACPSHGSGDISLYLPFSVSALQINEMIKKISRLLDGTKIRWCTTLPAVSAVF